MPVGKRLCSGIAAFFVIAGLSACGQLQVQSTQNSVSAQSTLAGPTWGAVVTGPSDATNIPGVQQATSAPPTPSQAADAGATGAATAAPTPTLNLPTLNRSLMGIQAYGNVSETDWGQM